MSELRERKLQTLNPEPQTADQGSKLTGPEFVQYSAQPHPDVPGPHLTVLGECFSDFGCRGYRNFGTGFSRVLLV